MEEKKKKTAGKVKAKTAKGATAAEKAEAKKPRAAKKGPDKAEKTGKTEKVKRARTAAVKGPGTAKSAGNGKAKKPMSRPAGSAIISPVEARTPGAGGPTPDGSAYRTGYVALIGRPNAGKSTLVNSILGEKVSIVSDKPQTTRISILGIKTTDQGQMIFVDNPGIHKPLHGLNRRMMNFVFSSIQTADVLCLLIDASQPFGHGDEFAVETLKGTDKPVFLLINKVDIVRKDTLLPLMDRYKELYPFKEIIPVSALKGFNLDLVEDLLYKELPAADRIYSPDELSDRTDRFLFAELVREKVLKRVTEELPFATAVLVDSIEHKVEPDRNKPGETRPLSVIKATIIVEKDNQRKIIIGRKGSRVKEIGIEARRDIEEILGHKVFLALHVKVEEDWRDAENVLDLIEGQ